MKDLCIIYFETAHEITVLGSFEDVGMNIEHASKNGKWAFLTRIDEQGRERKTSIKPFSVVGFSETTI